MSKPATPNRTAVYSGTLVDALPSFIKKENIAVFEKYKVFSAREVESRYSIILEGYNKVINQEGLCTLDMGKTQILPATLSYQGALAKTIADTKALLGEGAVKAQLETLKEIAGLNESLKSNLDALEKGKTPGVLVLDFDPEVGVLFDAGVSVRRLV